MIKKDQGFTLLELLMVLSLVSLISFMAVPSLYHVYKNEQTKQFFTVLESDLLYLQNQSIDSTLKNRLLIKRDHYTVHFGSKVMLQREYPAHIYAKSSEKKISFNNLGTVIEPATYHFYDDDGNAYRVVMPLGKGRQYIELP